MSSSVRLLERAPMTPRIESAKMKVPTVINMSAGYTCKKYREERWSVQKREKTLKKWVHKDIGSPIHS